MRFILGAHVISKSCDGVSRDMGGGCFLLSTWTQTQGFCLLLDEGRSQSISSSSSSTNIPWEVKLVDILQN